MADRHVVRIAAVSDLHCSRTSQGVLQPLFTEISARADVVLLAGDLTDYGHPDEARVLAREITASLHIPILAVLGNHDHESGHAEEVQQILCDHGVTMLDGEAHEVLGIGFAGTKGFGGGFGARSLAPWGEPIIKRFVQETVNEVLRLESALSRLRTEHRVVLLHYAPILGTVEPEPPEIYPFLGSSRLEDPLARYGVSAVFHGHAHAGSPEGVTSTGIPVYNVALPLLARTWPDQPPFRLIELPAPHPADTWQPKAGHPAG